MADIIVIFDFDKTIIDCDSDNWVIDDQDATGRFEDLLRIMPWNSAMDKIMSEIQATGKSIHDIAESLKKVPLHPCTISAIKSAYSLGCELRIVSDANMFFIETILKHHGLMGYFSEINTNPSRVDEDGKLRIFPYHDFSPAPLSCSSSICPPNMCKGLIVGRIQATVASEGKKKRFIYIGDGKGDYCPSLKLSREDYVMPRKNYPVWELISSNADACRAEVHEWSDAEELERVLLHLIHKAVSGDMLISADCKLEIISAAGTRGVVAAQALSLC